MRYLLANCRKCGVEIKVDIGDLAEEDAIKKMKEREFFNCSQGYHVELGSLFDNVVLKPGIYDDEKTAKTQEEYKNELIGLYGDENVITAKELQRIPDLKHMGFGFFSGSGFEYDRRDADDGTRFYVRIAKKAG